MTPVGADTASLLKEPVTDEMVEERASKLDWIKRVAIKENTQHDER
jgi:hypothetical protein